MSIKDFSTQIRNQNGTLISALRKLANVADPATLFEQVALMAEWEPWPEDGGGLHVPIQA